jgi:hypothetical protein
MHETSTSSCYSHRLVRPDAQNMHSMQEWVYQLAAVSASSFAAAPSLVEA